MKRLFSLVLTVIMVLSLFPVGAQAEGFTYEFESHCKSLYMLDMNTGMPVYTMNPDEKLPIASLTKIMTYIAVVENVEDIENTVVTVDASAAEILNATGSSLSGVITGEKLTILQLLNLMMIPSGNDAALVLNQYMDSVLDVGDGSATASTTVGTDTATHIPDSPFIKLMNKTATSLGCTSTQFTNAHGLYHPEHYSTARDMSVLAKHATTLPYFSDITSSRQYVLAPTNMSVEERTLYSTNKLFSEYADDGKYFYTYATGMKTGSLNESGYCIAASALYEGYSYIVIALGSPMLDEQKNEIDIHGEMLDSKELFKWAFTKLKQKTIATKGDLLGDIKLQYAWGKDRLQVVAEENVQTLLPRDLSTSSIVVTVDLPDKIQAPVKKGDLIGFANFSYAGKEIAKVNVVAADSVGRSEIVQTVEVGKEVLSSPVFLIIAGIILVFLLFYFISICMYNRKRKKMRKVKRYRNL